MKKALLMAAVMFAVYATTYAQNSQNGNVTVSATVISSLTLTQSSTTMNFGEIAQGVGTVTNPSNTEITYTLTGQPSHIVNVTYDASASLSDGSGHTLTFTPDFRGASTNTKPGPGNVTSPITTSVSGNYYFWLDGNVNVGSSQATGSYSGVWHLTVNY